MIARFAPRVDEIQYARGMRRCALALVALGGGCDRPDMDLFGPVYSSADDVLSLDGPTGTVRVHYSDRGPNGVDQSDDDENGLPDIAEYTAAEAEDALAYFAFQGFAPPVSDEETSLLNPGGNAALDIYLVDFTQVFGEQDVYAQVRRSGCIDSRCAASILLSNQGGYRPIGSAVFRAIQLAYDGSDREPGWMRSGAAYRMAMRFDGDVYYAGGFDAYLEASGESLLSAPAEIVGTPERSYAFDGTISGFELIVDPLWNPFDGMALLWWYFDDHVDGDVLRATVEASIDHDGPEALDAGLKSLGSSLEHEWPLFAATNLATGPVRGSRTDGYHGVRFETGVFASAEGAVVHDARTFAPLSAVYYRIDHDGGPLWLGTNGAPQPLTVTVHAVLDGNGDGPLGEMQGPFALTGGEPLKLGTFDAGGVWVSVTHPDLHGAPVDITMCIGSESDVSPCVMDVPSTCSAVPHSPAPFAVLAAALTMHRRKRKQNRQKPGPPNINDTIPPSR